MNDRTPKLDNPEDLIKPRKKRVYRTAEEKAKLRKKWDRRALARRKQKYKDDPNYRGDRQATMRERYRETSPSFTPKESCQSNVANLEDFSEERTFWMHGKKETGLSVDVEQMAEAMGYKASRLYTWHSNKQFPKPPHAVTEKGSMKRTLKRVYTLEEAKELISIIAKHQKQFAYYRKDHAETRNALFAVVEEKKRSSQPTHPPQSLN